MRAPARLAVPALVAVLSCSACGGEGTTRVVVAIDADPEVRARTAALRLRVESGAPGDQGLADPGAERDAFEQVLGTDAFEWPARTTLVPRDGDASRVYRVEASAIGAGGTVLAIVRAESGFVRGETRSLVLRLDASCLDVTSCAEDETCTGGVCREAFVPPDTLPRFDGAADAGEGDGMDASRPDADACTPIATYADEDGDGYGDLATEVLRCDLPAGRVSEAGDCDDACASCRPGGIEACDGSRDEDCDGTADEGCACATGATRACPGASDRGACVAGTQTCVEGSWSVCDGRVDPLPERCDGADEDCDGRVDEGLVRDCEAACGRGTQTCVAGAWQACSAPAPRTETCDGTDEDCDGRVDEDVLATFYRDADGDGYGAPTAIALACRAPVGYVARDGDCDDACPSCRPGGTETCDGALDEDCDGTADEGCACTTGATRACPGGVDTGECVAGGQTCVAGAWGACAGQVGPAVETCNARDDDCDDRVDEALERRCGPPTEVGVCTQGVEVCSAGSWSLCRGAVFPSTESCNGRDDDCDGSTDEGDVCGIDAGPPDAGPPDAGPPDAGPPDAGPPDAGPPPEDSGPFDAAGGDAGAGDEV